MKKRQPPFVLFSALLIFVGVAVVFGGRLMKDVNHDEAQEMKDRMAKQEQEAANKPAEKVDEAASLVESVKMHAEKDSGTTPKATTPAAPVPGPKGMAAMNIRRPSTILVPKQLTGKAQRGDTTISSLRYVNQEKKHKGN